MESEQRKLTAPYPPFQTFLSAIEHLKAIGIPHQIDRHIFPNFSGVTQGQILGTFRFLGLMDEHGKPSEDLTALVDAKERNTALKDILKKRYSKLTSLDLTRVSPGQFDKILGEYGVTGATQQKAKTFFIKAAQFAELPLTPLLTRKTRTSNGGRRKKSAGEKENPPLHSGTRYGQPSTLAQMMMSKFPDFNPEWSDDVKAKWFEGFERLTNIIEGKKD